jgi:6-phosphogluconolactonase
MRGDTLIDDNVRKDANSKPGRGDRTTPKRAGMAQNGEEILYVSCAVSNHVAILRRTPSGVLREADRIALEEGNARTSSLPLAFSPDRSTLYAALREAPYPVYRFVINPENGALSLQGRIELPSCPAYIAPDPSGRYLLSASYYSNHVAAVRAEHDGIHHPAPVILHGFAKAHSICFDRAGRYFYVGSVGDDQILQMRLDAVQAKLVLVSRFQARAGTGPRHIRFDASGRFLYAVNETNASIGAYSVDPADGHLTELHTLPLVPGDGAARLAADIHLAPDGRFLFASVRNPPRIAGFAVDRTTGRLAYVETVQTEPIPRGFVITPDGTQLIAPGQTTNKIAVFSIDSQSSRLDRIDSLTLEVSGSPSWPLIL